MLLFPPSETSSIDIHKWWRGNPHVWAELTGWDAWHEGASFCSHYASYKLILQGILSFLISSSATLLWRTLSVFLFSTNIIPPLSIAHLFIHSRLQSFMLLWRICPYFSICGWSAKCTCAGLSQRYPVAILYLGPCYYLLEVTLFHLGICKSVSIFYPACFNLKQFCVKRRYVIRNMKSRTLGW